MGVAGKVALLIHQESLIVHYDWMLPSLSVSVSLYNAAPIMIVLQPIFFGKAQEALGQIYLY